MIGGLKQNDIILEIDGNKVKVSWKFLNLLQLQQEKLLI